MVTDGEAPAPRPVVAPLMMIGCLQTVPLTFVWLAYVEVLHMPTLVVGFQQELV